MSVMRTTPRSPRRKASPGRGKTNWRRLERLTDAEIKAAVAKDPNTFIPDKTWWKRAKVVPPKSKAAAARYKIATIGEFMAWTKQVVRDPKAAKGKPKRWFDSNATATAARKRTRIFAPKSKAAARLAKAWSLARQVWGSDEEARDFLFRAHPLLEGRRPIDCILGSELGAQQIDEILGRLQHGTAA